MYVVPITVYPPFVYAYIQIYASTDMQGGLLPNQV